MKNWPCVTSDHLFLEVMGREWEGGGKGGTFLYEGEYYPMGRESGGNKMAEPEQVPPFS